MILAQDLETLRRLPGAALKTLNMVREVFTRHAGRRVTVGRGRGLADRLAQARALTAGCQSRGEAVQRIMAGLGVSRATAFRYVSMIGIEAKTGR